MNPRSSLAVAAIALSSACFPMAARGNATNTIETIKQPPGQEQPAQATSSQYLLLLKLQQQLLDFRLAIETNQQNTADLANKVIENLGGKQPWFKELISQRAADYITIGLNLASIGDDDPGHMLTKKFLDVALQELNHTAAKSKEGYFGPRNP